MSFTPARIAFAAALLSPSALMAQSSTAPVSSAEQKESKSESKKDLPSKGTPPMQTVEVKGTASDYDPRRDDTASKTVINSEEIRKYGDNNIYDVLKRAPGVTVTGNTIRMRGLGVGYTQILVNGDRPPPGFSLDNLTPDQIERIEIVRAATAEFSMQAIAGTINIILRKIVAKPQRDAFLNTQRSQQFKNITLGGTRAEKIGNLSYFLNGALYAGRNAFASRSTDQFNLPTGELTQSRESVYNGGGYYEGVALSPRLSWKLPNGDDLNLSAGAQAGRSRWQSQGNTTNFVGSFGTPDWIESHGGTPGSQRSFRGEANWIAKLAGGKLDFTVSAQSGRNRNDSDNELFTALRALRLERDWDTTTTSTRYNVRAKFTRSLFDGHALSTGLEASVEKSDEIRDRRDQLGDAAPTHVVENFEPKVTRAAGYVQDEWNITRQLSIYLGTRWEGIQTDSEGSGLAEVSSRNHVLSPVAQTLYKFPGASGRQLRLALTRTYKAPTTQQLTAKRYESVLNTRFAPDSGGNPNLRPELANGIDLTYEHFFTPGALFSVSASKRAITDYIRTRLDLDAQGRWLYQPINDGSATVRSLESEIKLPLKLVTTALDGFDARASVARHWSHVSTVPGPDNRLDAQVPLSANMGIDYKKDKLGFGASFAYQKGGWIQVSEAQGLQQQSRRDLDAYASWKLDTRYTLRLSLGNILGTDTWSERVYADASGISRQHSFQPGSMRTGLNLEAKF